MGHKQVKPRVLSRTDQFPETVTKLTIQYVNGEIDSFYIQSTLKCFELKELVYSKISKTLEPKNMILKLNGQRIRDEEVLAHLLGINDVIVQQKIPLNQVSMISCDSVAEDVYTLEKGVAKMPPCGHPIGRIAIKELIKTLINDKRYKIICPFPECEAEWDYNHCNKVGCFTYEQNREFTCGLNKNWMEAHTKECPGCKNAVQSDDEGRRMVLCSNQKCKFGPFCFLCLKKWKNKNSQTSCGNIECEFSKDYYERQNSTKPFTFYDPDTLQFFTIEVPALRLCPKCKMPIEHEEGCKHMQCPKCKTQFCFVCLQLFEKNWKCGAFNEFCHFVAEKQRL